MFSRSLKVRFIGRLQNQLCCDYFNLQGTKDVSRCNAKHLSSSSRAKYNFDVSQEEIQEFYKISPEIVKMFTEHKAVNSFPGLKAKVHTIIDYPSKIGDAQLPVSMLGAYKILEKLDKLTKENIALAYFLGWLTEMAQSALYMVRDTIDDIHIRNNSQTYRPGTESNDAQILENSIFILLKQNFGTHTNYLKLLHLFQNTFYNSSKGSSIELVMTHVEQFNMELVNSIAKYKVASSSYVLPIKAAWYLTGVQECPNEEEDVDNILTDIALFKKIETDYLDSFDDQPNNFNNKHGICSWLAVKSLEKANNEQRIMLQQKYGKKDQKACNDINDLYRELDLETEFKNFKLSQHQKVQKNIQQLTDAAMRMCLAQMSENIFGMK